MQAAPFLAALLLLAPAANAAAGDIRPGLWKITLESRVAATPGWQPEPFELTQCLTEADTAHPERLLTGGGGQGVDSCDFPKRDYSGGHLRFEVSCAGTLGLTGRGELSFTETRIDGNLDASFGGEERTDMSNQLHAVRLGDCAGSGTAPPAALIPPPALAEPSAE
jgi:hypothetical protein